MEEIIEKIVNNNSIISELLQKNEELYHQLSEEENKEIIRSKRIEFPVGRIKRLQEHESNYHLYEIIKEEKTVKNAGYFIQTGELYQYLTERFDFYGSIKTMLYMNWFICNVSVIEVMVDSSAFYLGIDDQLQKLTFRNRLNNKSYKKCVGITSDMSQRIHNLYDLRNKIHLKNNKKIDFDKLKFTLEDVKESECILKQLVKLLYENAVPNYIKTANEA